MCGPIWYFCLLQSWASMVLYGFYLSFMIVYGPECSCMVLCGPVSSCFVLYSLVWLYLHWYVKYLVLCSHVWSCIVFLPSHNLVWTCIVLIGLVCFSMVMYDLIRICLTYAAMHDTCLLYYNRVNFAERLTFDTKIRTVNVWAVYTSLNMIMFFQILTVISKDVLQI